MSASELSAAQAVKKEEAARPGKLSWDNVADLEAYLPRRKQRGYNTIAQVRKAFSLPVINGQTRERREELNLAFDHAGGFEMIFSSLKEHAFEMGQFPVNSFLGYGALQQISQNGMIRACVQTIADDVTRKWIQVIGSDENTELVEQLQDLDQNIYHLRDLFNSAQALSGYMGGAYIFIDTGADGSDLELPLIIDDNSAEIVGNRDLRFTVVDPSNVSPGMYNCSNPLRRDYMKPRSFSIMGRAVHASRLIAVYDNEVPALLKPAYNFLGIPQAQILWDYVLHFQECRVYSSDLLKKFTLLVFKTDMDTVLSTAGGIKNFDLRVRALERYRDNNSVFCCDFDDEDVTNVQVALGGTTDIVRQALEMIAAVNRTPAVKLLGISPSGFNATGQSDITNYYDHISSKQELLRDQVLKCIKIMQLANFGKIDPQVNFIFNALDDDSANVRMTKAKTFIDALAVLQDRNVISASEVREAVRNDPNCGLEFLSGDLPDMPDEQDFRTDTPGGTQYASFDDFLKAYEQAGQADTEAENEGGA